MNKETELMLIKTALEYRKHSYSPYSHFKVGAALLGKNGRVFGGCNIENAGYSSTNCAERTAFFKAVSEGTREFEAIAIVGGAGEEPSALCAPCGVCRQVMAEFCKADEFSIIMAVNEENYEVHTLAELLPYGFGPANLDT
ncbi:MAG: cytidine deaminase [Lachnospiraceae bacterium]|nr:cytidine deaminase [Lachnospiraceae bacterium]